MAPYIKGGVWTNVEDEILKAAISKYGLNQWARVSSLLARKTAKQCKARWNEWLDPSIKKIEWSREEDEKLLHLAKLMPSQWRSIAPLVGRTANQCIERYQKLLDDAEAREKQGFASNNDLNLSGVQGDAAAPTQENNNRKVITAGEGDALAESKPARPDPMDMDEDEKEMLSEARARLANTQGKKAKRKDRERMLAESSRLAMLQKRRELKQAGINMKLGNKKSTTSIDYNADIPFQHKPAAGVHDTSEEKLANESAKSRFDKLMMHKGIMRKDTKDNDDNDSNKNKKRTSEEQQSATEQAAAARAQKLQQLNQSEQISKRRKLDLPAPQVQDNELEKIVKQDKLESKMRDTYLGDDEPKGISAQATSGIAADYEQSKRVSEPTRTPQVAPEKDRIYQATRDVRDLTATQSSLLGGENDPDQSEYGSTIVPSEGGSVQTPNPLAMKSKKKHDEEFEEEYSRPSLTSAFQRLPKPQNNFEIAIPEEDEVSHEANLTYNNNNNGYIDDAGERERILKRQQEIEEQKALARRSRVIQKSLPRPTFDDIPLKPSFNKNRAVHEMIHEEMRRLVLSDELKYSSGKESHTIGNDSIISDLDDTTRAFAERQIEAEMEAIKEVHTPSDKPPELDYSSGSPENLLTTLSQTAEKSNKSEKKLNLVLGGYMKRQEMLSKKLGEAHEAYQKSYIDSEVFSELRDKEAIALSSRVSGLQEEVNFLADAERAGQERYRQLKETLATLQ